MIWSRFDGYLSKANCSWAGRKSCLPQNQVHIYDWIVSFFSSSFDQLFSIVEFWFNCIVEIFGSLKFLSRDTTSILTQSLDNSSRKELLPPTVPAFTFFSLLTTKWCVFLHQDCSVEPVYISCLMMMPFSFFSPSLSSFPNPRLKY